MIRACFTMTADENPPEEKLADARPLADVQCVVEWDSVRLKWHAWSGDVDRRYSAFENSFILAALRHFEARYGGR